MNFDDGKQKKKSSASSSGPRAKVCYICGKQTLIHGYQHHIEQCGKLFLQREELKPPKERRKLPPDPFSIIDSSSKGKSLDEINKLATQAFNDGGGMSKCLNCGRSFLPEKLPIHNKSCTPSNPARRIDENINRRIGRSSTISENGGGGGDYDNNSPRVSSSRGGSRSTGNVPSSIPEFIPLDMTQCIDCGRSFNEIAYERHVKICKKVFMTKRKQYDSSKHRAEGTDIAQYNKSNNKFNKTNNKNLNNAKSSNVNNNSSSTKQGNWKEESERFRAAMKEARKVSFAEKKSKATGIPLHQLLPPPSFAESREDSSFIPCPHCGRTFSEKAGERHIPQCQNIFNKPSRLARGSGHNATTFQSNHNSSPAKIASGNSNSNSYTNDNSNDWGYSMGDVADYHQVSSTRKVTNSLGKSNIRSYRNSFESSLLEEPIATNDPSPSPNAKQNRMNSSQGNNSIKNRSSAALKKRPSFDNTLNDPLMDKISPLPNDRIQGGEISNVSGKIRQGGFTPTQSPRLSIEAKHALSHASVNQLERAIIEARKREMNGNNSNPIKNHCSSQVRSDDNINRRSQVSQPSQGIHQSYNQANNSKSLTQSMQVKNAFTGAGNQSFNSNREYPDRPVSRGRYSGTLGNSYSLSKNNPFSPEK